MRVKDRDGAAFALIDLFAHNGDANGTKCYKQITAARPMGIGFTARSRIVSDNRTDLHFSFLPTLSPSRRRLSSRLH